MKYKIIIILSLVIVIFFILLLPRYKNKRIEAIEYSPSDQNYSIERIIEFQGNYFWRPFGKSYYKGKIIISGVDYTQKYDTKLKYFMNGCFNGNLNYTYGENGQPIIKNLGRIVLSNNFNSIILYLPPNDKKDSEVDFDKIITGPATTRDEAINLFNEMINRFDLE